MVSIPQGKTAAGIAQSLEARIRSGSFPDGAALPTVRDLAQEMGVNKNTALRAYQALAQKGLLTLVRGRGAFVRPGKPALAPTGDPWLAQLDQLLSEARSLRMSRQAVVQEMIEAVDRAFAESRLRLAFVECNAADIEAIGGELSAAVGRPMDGILLADFLARPEGVGSNYDLVVTPFFHLGQVGQALGPAAREKVVGIHVAPPHDVLLKIARLHALVVGLVCDQPATAETLGHILRTYHRSATILTALMDDDDRLQALLSKADAIVVTQSSHQRLLQLHPQVPLVTVTFKNERQSVEFLQERIRELVASRR